MAEIFGDSGFDITAAMEHAEKVAKSFEDLYQHLTGRGDEIGVQMLENLRTQIQEFDVTSIFGNPDAK